MCAGAVLCRRRFLPRFVSIAALVWCVQTPAEAADGPADPAAAVAQAGSYLESGRPKEALEALETVSVSERTYDVHHLLGVASEQLGENRQARRHYRAAIESRPTSSGDHLRLADLYFADEKFALAVQAYESAERHGAESAEMHFRMAAAYHHLGTDLGDVQIRMLIGAEASTIQDGVYVLRPVAQRRIHYLVAPRKSAIYHVRAAIGAGLDKPEVRLLEADIWLAARRFARAAKMYGELEDQIPPNQSAGYYARYAEACLAAGDLECYLTRLEQAIAFGSEPPPGGMAKAFLTVADWYSAAGNLQKYIHYLELATQEDPTSADLRYRLGNAYHEAGRDADAARAWRITLELEPNHPDRRRMLERIQSIG